MQGILYKLEKSVKIQEVKDEKLVSSFDLKSTPILNLIQFKYMYLERVLEWIMAPKILDFEFKMALPLLSLC